MCQIANIKLKDITATTGCTINLTIFSGLLLFKMGDINQLGIPNMINGGAIRVIRTCCTICALKRYWSLNICNGERIDKNITSMPSENKIVSIGSDSPVRLIFFRIGPVKNR